MRNYIAIPNQLLLDPMLRPSTKRVAVALYAYRNHRSNSICRTVKALAVMAHCCRNTVLQALEELEERHFLKRKHRYGWNTELQRVVYKANRYTLSMDMSRGYTLVSRTLLRAEITHAQFAVLLLLCAKQGQANHSYPSLRRMAAALLLAKSTICIAIRVLVHKQHLAANHCRNHFGSYSCNSYFLIVTWDAATLPGALATAYHSGGGKSTPPGGLIFDTTRVLTI